MIADTMASAALICDTEPWKDLKVYSHLIITTRICIDHLFDVIFSFLLFINAMQSHVEDIKKTHLRDLMNDTERCKSMMVYEVLDSLI